MPKAKKRSYTVLNDDRVVLVYRCEHCGKTAEVHPAFHAEAGTPICTESTPECEGRDMEYVETRLLRQ